MISNRDGHIRVLPLHVANKIAAGEVVERPASVVKELVENSIDAGSTNIRISITQGGRKLVSVQDDGCGMTRDDAVLSLERQATSKILDVTDIEEIDTLGFRGEAIPSIASVSRFTITTRRKDSDEGTLVQVNAGTLADVRTTGCPPGTLIEVRDLFCNVPARRKFLRSYATEENHVKQIFIVHALAHPEIGFSLVVDGRELHRLAPATNSSDRILELFGKQFAGELLKLDGSCNDVSVTGFIEKPNLSVPTRRDQYIFINGRPATANSIAYAIREAYPRRIGDTRPAAIIFIRLPPSQVDVNVHPTKREVRFRDNNAVKNAVINAIDNAIGLGSAPAPQPVQPKPALPIMPPRPSPVQPRPVPEAVPAPMAPVHEVPVTPAVSVVRAIETPKPLPSETPAPVAMEFAIDPDSTQSRPWKWFRFLAETESGYLLIETNDGMVTINAQAARERITYEQLLHGNKQREGISQQLLIPETIQLNPVDFSRIRSSMTEITAMGFQIEEFGHNTLKIEAVPQLIGNSSPSAILSTIANDLAEANSRRGGERWREELIAKSIARSFAGASKHMTEDGAVKMVEELCECRMPYICPRGKPVMIFTSTNELNRKFKRD